MNVIGKMVNHKTFGVGTVTELTDTIITISFRGTEKRFIYPDAFKRFLVFKGQRVQEHVEKLIREKEAVAQRQKRIEQEENERRQKLLNFKISANSHLVMDIPSEEIDSVFQTLSVSAGTYLSGASKGLPRVLDRVKPNSLCLITSCLKGQEETERKLVGAFMVEEDFFGEEVSTGIIKGHPKYHLLVPNDRCILFWPQLNRAAPSRWGGVAFKYCSTAAANQMLSEMVGAVFETDQSDAVQEFYQYFCKINSLNPLNGTGKRKLCK
ncbi:MAG: hypothetical protein VB071_06635 [Lawsonibacter sp.]|jgi:hypothetical protein|nr:hypothetical protein [Lawsonibacter sp.]